MMNPLNELSRRSLLKSLGYFSLSFGIPLQSEISLADAPNSKPPLPGDLNTNRKLSAWLRINADQTVTLLIGKVELGQGVLTAVTQVCAEELDVDLKRIKIISGDTALVPNEGVTAGSFSMPYCATAVQFASAELRAILLGLASEKLKVPFESLSVQDGVIKSATGLSVNYWDLVLGSALDKEATGLVKPKDPSQYKYIGKNIIRVDFPKKMMGQAIFLQELRPKGMVYAHIVRPPSYLSELLTVNENAVQSMPGVLKIVRNGSFLGVIAKREQQALAAAIELGKSAKWSEHTQLPTHEGIFDWLLKTKPNKIIATKKQARATSEVPTKTIEATYFRPFHMHASIGTSCAIATLDAQGQLLIQTHSQSVFETGLAIAKMLGMDPSKVRCQHEQGAGCYGHNMADDADAALLACAYPGVPVRLQYTRQQEHQWEPYGSAMVIKTKAALDDQGHVLDWDLQLWSNPHTTRPSGEAGNLLSARYLQKPFELPLPINGGPPNFAADRNAIALYDFPGHQVLTHFITDMPVRVSSTRGLGAYANVFAIESFMDELAHAFKVDPVEYRLRFLKDARARDVIQKAAAMLGWGRFVKTPGKGRGIGFAKYKNIATYCAVALEVEVNEKTGRIRVTKAVASADAGQIVNPDGVKNQIEGGLIQSLSWTLKEEVKFNQTNILAEDWTSYPILTFSEIPNVQVELIDRPGMPFLGCGEASQGPTGAALANAVFDATGIRFRRLPLTPDRVKQGLQKL
jgi:nicotinate dehydrogenase subunit B